MPASPPAARGFTLVELAIVIAIVAVAGAMVLKASGGMLETENRRAVRLTLNTVDLALANFVAANKRLPCPADGALASSAPDAGVELVAANGACAPVSQVRGVIPWVTLGLSENEASDPWLARLSYRVDPALAGRAPLPPLMNMSQCDPAASGPAAPSGACLSPAAPCAGSAACTSPASFLAGKGLDVWDGQNGAAGFAQRQNNRAAGTGAAYVVISHGRNGVRAYNRNGVLQPGTMPPHPQNEAPNFNNQALVLAATALDVYRDAPLNENPALQPTPPGPPVPPQTRLYADDYLSHPTIMAVLARANLGPRAH